MNESKKIFIISLPRSGSTLLQRLLTRHKEVEGVGEPWFLLNFFSLHKAGRVGGDYDPSVLSEANCEFLDDNEIREVYECGVLNLIDEVYAKKVNGRDVYYVDKTPRYYMIDEQFFGKIRDSHFIFLYRNPLAVFSSMCRTWASGKLHISKLIPDIEYGMTRMVVQEDYLRDNGGNVIRVNYDNLVLNTHEELSSISEFLGIKLEFTDTVFDLKAEEGLGDPKFGKKYKNVSRKSVLEYVGFYNNVVRVWTAKKILEKAPVEYLQRCGNSKGGLMETVSEVKWFSFGAVIDVYCLLSSLLKHKIKQRVFSMDHNEDSNRVNEK